MTPAQFGAQMQSAGVKRASIIGVDGQYVVSNESLLSPLLKTMEEEAQNLALPDGTTKIGWRN
jgi:hypothetical protein